MGCFRKQRKSGEIRTLAGFEPEEGEERSKTRPMLRERVYHPKETVSRKKGREKHQTLSRGEHVSRKRR